jgi:DNA-binding PadR family transcriptional regulator
MESEDLSRRGLKKGSLGMLVLRQLHERHSYGYDLCERLRERSDGALSFEDGAIYPLVHALERDGLAEGYWGTEEAVDGGDAGRAGGPRRRNYRLTPCGAQALRSAIEQWSAFSGAVERVLGERPAVDGEGER